MKKDYLEKFANGEVLFSEESLSNTMYFIQSGKVAIFKDYGTPKQTKLAEITDGFFGEMAMVENAKRTATAVVTEDAVIQLISKEDLPDYLTEYPLLRDQILRTISKRIRNLNREYMKVCGCINECVKAEETGKAKDAILLKQMKKIAENV